MNLFKNIVAISLCLGLIFGTSACVHHHHHTRVVKHDNGKHKGWYKGKGHAKGHPGNKGRGHGKGHK